MAWRRKGLDVRLREGRGRERKDGPAVSHIERDTVSPVSGSVIDLAKKSAPIVALLESGPKVHSQVSAPAPSLELGQTNGPVRETEGTGFDVRLTEGGFPDARVAEEADFDRLVWG